MLLSFACFGQASRDYAVEIQKTGDSYPYGITWKFNTNTTWRVIKYKDPDSLVWHQLDSSLGKGNSFFDSTLLEGQRRDYLVKEYRNNYAACGYISIGHLWDGNTKQRTLLLLVDSNYLLPLASEIEELTKDIEAEDWKIQSRYCGREESVITIKSWIQNVYLTDTTKEYSVYLLGRIPVPYSGALVPDGHYPDHFGAWPADVYYVNFDSSWTDSIVNYAVASNPRNHNIPGDGKFDPWEVPFEKAKIPIGRVDMYDMPAFGDDTSLIKRYLKKAHNFRKVSVEFRPRAIIEDNFGSFAGEAFASGAWRTFSTLLGDSIQSGDYRNSLASGSYLFSYGCGGGSYLSAGGIGTSYDFVSDSFANPFTMLFGSYFGDWDNKNNYLRAPLASKGWGLVNVWSGRPHWLFHHSGLGDPIGRASLESQRADSSVYFVGYGDAFVHAALMGDPSLPVFPLPPGASLSASTNCSEQKIYLNWTKSDQWDSVQILQKNQQGTLTILATLPADSLSFSDTFTPELHEFMVRGKNLKFTPSGSFFQYSPWISTKVLLHAKTSAQILKISDSLCFGDSVQIADNSLGQINWTVEWFLNNQFIGNQVDTSILISLAGEYSLVLKTTNDSACMSFDSLHFRILDKIEPNFQFDKHNYCFGDTLWMFADHGSSDHLWKHKKSILSEDSIAFYFTDSVGYHAIEHVNINTLGCSESVIDSVYLSGPILKSVGLSPFNHSICIDSDQDQAQSFIETNRTGNLEIWIDKKMEDSLPIQQNIFSRSHKFSVSGEHLFTVKIIDSLGCYESDSFFFKVYEKAPSPTLEDSLLITHQSAQEIRAKFYPKAYYIWGGSCNNSQGDSINKRWYSCATADDGDYLQWVVLEDSNECISDTSYFWLYLRTGIEDLESIGFESYPNPSKGQINWISEIPMEKVLIYSINGQLIEEKELMSNQISIELNLKPGTYLLSFFSQAGQRISKKIIIN